MSITTICRRALAAALLTTAVVAFAADEVRAQSYEPMRYAAFEGDPKSFHNKKVRIHAYFISRKTPQMEGWDSDFFENAGFTKKKYYRFEVVFDDQKKAGLFPSIERRGRAAKHIAQLAKMEEGTKLTFFGTVKRLGDGASAAFFGAEETPSLLHIEKLELGWVKSFEQYIGDLQDPKLYDETLAMLKRGAKQYVKPLQKIASTTSKPMELRVLVLRVLGKIAPKSHATKLATMVKKDKDEEIRTAALLALAGVKQPEALKTISRMLGEEKNKAFASNAAIQLQVAGIADAAQLKKACGRRYDLFKGDLVAAAMAAGNKVLEKQPGDAAKAFDIAISLDATAGTGYYGRGQARIALATGNKDMAKKAVADIAKAIELGVTDKGVHLAHARALHRAGDADGAKAAVAKALEADPKSEEVANFKKVLEGGSELMINARTSTWGKVSLQVPKKWEDDPKEIDKDRGLIGYVSGVARHRSEGDDGAWIELFIIDATPEEKLDPAVAALMTPQFQLKITASVFGHEVKEEGEFEMASGAKAAWCRSERKIEGTEMRYFEVFVIDGGRSIYAYFRTDEKSFKDLRPAMEESLRSLVVKK